MQLIETFMEVIWYIKHCAVPIHTALVFPTPYKKDISYDAIGFKMVKQLQALIFSLSTSIYH